MADYSGKVQLLDQDDEVSVPRADTLAVGHGRPRDDLATPASEADVRRSYVDATSMGYVINGVGPVTAVVAVTLALTDSVAGFHSAGLAAGLLTAGLTTAGLDRVIGTPRIHLAALVVLALSFLALALGPTVVVTLLAAFGVGLGFGVMLSHVNQTLTAGGGSLARVRTARATLIAQIAGVMVPIIIGVTGVIGVGLGWAAAPVLILVGLSLLYTRGRTYRPLSPASARSTLTRAYWTLWLFVVVVSAIEWAVLFWASTLAAQQTGVLLKEATFVVSAFLGGTIVARAALSLPAVSRLEPIRLLRAGLAVLLVGSLLAWATTSFALSVLGFLVIGLGSGVLFPLGVALSMDTSPRQPQLASSRLVLAPGLGMLALPPILGLLADASGVSMAWLLVPMICLVSLGLTVAVARDRDLVTAGVASP